MFKAVLTAISESSVTSGASVLDLESSDYFRMLFDFASLSFSSVALGLLFGLGASLLLKHLPEESQQASKECMILFAIAYLSYLIAEGLHLSGIMTLFCCGFTMSHYAFHNVLPECQTGSLLAVETLSSVAEGFLYVYLGMSSMSISMATVNVYLITVTMVGTVLARVLSVMVSLGLTGHC